MSQGRVRAAFAIAALMLGASGVAAAANWVPDDGDWSHFRRLATRLGATEGKGAFTASLDDVRVKWERETDPSVSYWIPPVAADLDNDGTAEIVAAVGNASATVGPPPTVNLASGFEVLDGKTGALECKVGPTTGNLEFFSPTLGDVDADGNGEIVTLLGNPITGTHLTNKITAFEANCAQKWAFSDADWGAKIPEPLNSLAIGNVDGEKDKNEVVAVLLLAKVAVSASGGKVLVEGSEPDYRLLALNGESGSKSWEVKFGHASLANPALADMNGDGTLDVVWGSGLRSGTFIETSSVKITLTPDFEDDRFFAYKGAAAPSELWSHAAAGFFPGELASAPALVDLDGDGKLEVVQPLWRRNLPPGIGETAKVRALSNDGTLRWDAPIAAAVAGLSASDDLNADGLPDILVQTDNGADVDKYRVIAIRHDGAVLWRSSTFGRTLSSAPAVGDITGDGKPEVLVIVSPTAGNGQLVVLNGDTGTEIWRRALGPVLSTGGPLLVDLDGDDDGRLEILVNTGEFGKRGKLLALEPILPDLTASDLAFEKPKHIVGEPEAVSATIRNVGDRASGSGLVRFTDNGAVVHEVELGALDPGAEQTVTFTWTPASSGLHTVEAEVDPDKGVVEDVETNNAVSRTVSVEVVTPIENKPPVAGFFHGAAVAGRPTPFRDTSRDPDGKVVAWFWTFGDGGESTERHPKHTFAAPGSYLVSLTVTDDLGASDSVEKVVRVCDPATPVSIGPGIRIEICL